MKQALNLRNCTLAALLGLAVNVSHAQSAPSKPATPIDPITGIIDAFRTHSVVALGEGDHGNEQGHAFRLKLINDPRFAAVVNDIVVEFGNSLGRRMDTETCPVVGCAA